VGLRHLDLDLGAGVLESWQLYWAAERYIFEALAQLKESSFTFWPCIGSAAGCWRGLLS